MGMIEDALRLADARLRDVEAFAVTRGPGTFTGLRIGISAAKGMALAYGKPLLGISGLEALAAQCALPSYLLCPWIDARRSEVYCAQYRFSEGRIEMASPEIALAPQKALQNLTQTCLFMGNGAELYRDLIRTSMGDLGVLAPAGQGIIRASTIALLAEKRLEQGSVHDIGKLVPLYIRQSDAELKLGKQLVSAGAGAPEAAV